MIRLKRTFLAAALALAAPTAAMAACSLPAVGTQVGPLSMFIQMNATSGSPKMGTIGSAGSADLTGEGTMIYDRQTKTLAICDGTNWASVSGGTGTDSSAGGTGPWTASLNAGLADNSVPDSFNELGTYTMQISIWAETMYGPGLVYEQPRDRTTCELYLDRGGSWTRVATQYSRADFNYNSRDPETYYDSTSIQGTVTATPNTSGVYDFSSSTWSGTMGGLAGGIPKRWIVTNKYGSDHYCSATVNTTFTPS